MRAGIAYRLVADGADIVLHDGVQRACGAARRHRDRRTVRPSILRHAPDRRGEIVRVQVGRAQRVEGRPRFLHRLVQPSREPLEIAARPGRIVQVRDGVAGDHPTALDRLDESVVQLSRQAGAFRQPLVEAGCELRGDPPDVQAVEERERTGERGDDQRAEPRRLVPGRQDRERQGRAGLVPHAVVVAGEDAEAVGAGLEIRVERRAALAHVVPLRFPALQAIAESDAFRNGEAERGVVDTDRASQRRHLHVPPYGYVRSSAVSVRTTTGGSRALRRMRPGSSLTTRWCVTNHSVPFRSSITVSPIW